MNACTSTVLILSCSVMDGCFLVFMACRQGTPCQSTMVRYLQYMLRSQREKSSKGNAKGRRIPKFPHNFPCGLCELNFPGSQHRTGMLYPCPWKPQRDVSCSQLVHCTLICLWGYMPRQGDNHIPVAWVPLWWGIMLSRVLHWEVNPCQPGPDLSSSHEAVQIFSV